MTTTPPRGADEPARSGGQHRPGSGRPSSGRPGGRVIWLVTSPRLPGMLTASAWAAVSGATTIVATDAEHPLCAELEAVGRTVEIIPVAGSDTNVATDRDVDPDLAADSAADPADIAARVVGLARDGHRVVFLAGDDDRPVADRLAELLAGGEDSAEAAAGATAGTETPELEVLIGAYDPPGARLLDLAAVMDRLRRECPWDREQTHQSLVRYLLEETYETIEALETGSADEIREELGDLLFQAFFHARIAEEHPDRPWNIDDVAGGVVEKLVRRHPHVFADVEVADAAEVEANWETIKAAEKRRHSVLDGVPRALPALALADKVLGRFVKSGTPVELSDDTSLSVDAALPPAPTADQVGAALFAVAAAARRVGIDPEQALRTTVRQIIGEDSGDERDANGGGAAPQQSGENPDSRGATTAPTSGRQLD